MPCCAFAEAWGFEIKATVRTDARGLGATPPRSASMYVSFGGFNQVL